MGAVKDFYSQYERHISSGALLLGFVLDNLSFRRIDRAFDTFVLIFYLLVAIASVVWLTFIGIKSHSKEPGGRLALVLPLVLQFVFGGLASAFFIFYSRSGTLVGSWPFLLILLGLILGNELLKERYGVFTFRMSVLFFLIYSFTIAYLPVAMGKIGVEVFVLAGSLSLLIIWQVAELVFKFLPQVAQLSKRRLTAAVGGIFVLMNIFYFSNILPPIPLVLKDSGVFHYVNKVGKVYNVSFESKTWLEALRPYEKFHFVPGKNVYVYSSVFAPTDLGTDIVHNWQFYNEQRNKWESRGRIDYPIVGGTDGGYRGYSVKSSIVPGRWRVDVETERGALIGRIKFEVVDEGGVPALTEGVR